MWTQKLAPKHNLQISFQLICTSTTHSVGPLGNFTIIYMFVNTKCTERFAEKTFFSKNIIWFEIAPVEHSTRTRDEWIERMAGEFDNILMTIE